VVDRDRLALNVEEVRRRIQNAACRVGRSPDEVQLVAVTKYVTPAVVRLLYDLGLRDFGESRPQVLWEKQPILPPDVRWHLIGQLQTNKVRRTLPMVSLLHSLDRLSLVEELVRESARSARPIDLLVEVKIVDDEAKHGFGPQELPDILRLLAPQPGLRVRGLMTMASLSEEAENARPVFRELRERRDELARSLAIELPFLSMGMSQDFEVAIEEGATHVRVGSTLFEGVDHD
jgi:pyridoxal phosphate enzyme (YggS family)